MRKLLTHRGVTTQRFTSNRLLDLTRPAARLRVEAGNGTGSDDNGEVSASCFRGAKGEEEGNTLRAEALLDNDVA